MADKRNRFVGFDIGGTKCAVTLAEQKDEQLHIFSRKQIPTDHNADAYEIIDRMYALAREMGATDEVIGISCGGPMNAEKGVILSPPNLPGWDEIRIVHYLKEQYSARAYLENDANACAVAEWLYGAGRGCRNMIFLTFGTGMGAGLILNGRLYTGTNGMAGEIGHVRMAQYGPVGYGKAGSFEGFCSGSGIAQLGQMIAREKQQRGQACSFSPEGAVSGATAREIAACAQRRETDALRVFDICGEMLGKGLAILIDILNPDRIVIGSIYQRSGTLLEESMRLVLEKECLAQSLHSCSIVPAELGDAIGDYAALCTGIYGQIQEERQHAI